MKVRTLAHLSETLDGELAWRKRELATLGFMVSKARETEAQLLRRAGVALLYAHWEGFVKSAGTAYVEFVSAQRLPHRSLNSNFLALAIKARLHDAKSTNKASIYNEVAAYFVERLDERATLRPVGAVQTKSNLGAEVFREIIATLGLDYARFELKEKNVIEKLRTTRNTVAHGKEFGIDHGEFDRLFREVRQLIEDFRDEIDTAAQSGRYRRSDS